LALPSPDLVRSKIRNEERSLNVLYNQQKYLEAPASPVSWSAAARCRFSLPAGRRRAAQTRGCRKNRTSKMQTRPSISLTPKSARYLLPRESRSSKKLKSKAGMWLRISSLIKPIPSPVWTRKETRNWKIEIRADSTRGSSAVLHSSFIIQTSSFSSTCCTLTADAYGF